MSTPTAALHVVLTMRGIALSKRRLESALDVAERARLNGWLLERTHGVDQPPAFANLGGLVVDVHVVGEERAELVPFFAVEAPEVARLQDAQRFELVHAGAR